MFYQSLIDFLGMPVIAVCCRTFRPTGDLSPHSLTNKCLWTTLNMFTRILDFVINKYDVFAKVLWPLQVYLFLFI